MFKDEVPPARFTLRQFDGDDLNVSREADTATRYSVGAEARLEVSLRSKTRGLANRRLETFLRIRADQTPWPPKAHRVAS